MAHGEKVIASDAQHTYLTPSRNETAHFLHAFFDPEFSLLFSLSLICHILSGLAQRISPNGLSLLTLFSHLHNSTSSTLAFRPNFPTNPSSSTSK